MAKASYAIALGSNRPVRGNQPPRALIAQAMAALHGRHMKLRALSHIVASPPMGPSRRTYANAAAIVESRLAPPALLRRLQKIERIFGRRRAQKWGARSLDLDIILWSGGIWADKKLAVPHPAFRERLFVLDPLAEIAPFWRDPVSGASIRQLQFRAKKPKPVDRNAKPL